MNKLLNRRSTSNWYRILYCFNAYDGWQI